MKRLIAVFGAAALFATPALAETYELDPAHSTVSFGVKHLMVSTVRGEFRTVSGTVDWDPKAPGKTRLEATIDAKSIDTRDAKRDEHLRSPDFFDVANHPTIRFTTTKVQAAGKGKLKIVGALTMHGVTRPVILDVAGPSAPVKNPWGKTVMAASGTAKVNRKDFGMTWNKAMDSGGVVVGDEVEIRIDAELIKKEPAEASR